MDYESFFLIKEKDYPKYLAEYYKEKTGEKLDLKHPKTFNEKIQWLKLYDCTQLKKELTDKVLVRDWIKDKIGDEYLKPVCWFGERFQDIPFDELPNSFIIKSNHGCKWNFTIKDKEKFLKIPRLYHFVENQFDKWQSLQFWPFAGFEMQYKDIKPLILIEKLLIDEDKDSPSEYEIFCFNGKPKLYQKIPSCFPRKPVVYNEDFSISDITFDYLDTKCVEPAEDTLKKAVELSEYLSKGFKLVRVDWIVCNSKIYFNEMTFTPYSGFYNFLNQDDNKLLGSMLNLKE